LNAVHLRADNGMLFGILTDNGMLLSSSPAIEPDNTASDARPF
jgi:hypothetical protein